VSKKCIRKIICSVLTFFVAVTTLTGCSSTITEREVTAEKPLVFRLSLVDGESTCYYKGAEEIANRVFDKTNGRIVIKVIPGGALGSERATVELAMNGDLDIATSANSVLTNWIPQMSILDQAYLWKNPAEAHAAVDGKIGRMIEEEAQRKMGVHVIGYMESGFRDVFSTKPINKVEDFKGVKIRTMQNRYHMAAFKAFGAMPVALPFGEQFTALQQGTIDACENGVSGCYTNGFYEVTKHITNTKHAFVYIMLCMSDKSFNMIPEDLRPLFLEGVKEGCNAERQYLKDANKEATEKLKEKGVTFHDIDTEQLQQLYRAEAQAEGFTFEPEWQAGVDEAIEEAKRHPEDAL
jgi:tripartite ATP-independent transporter DctP family solute receptor